MTGSAADEKQWKRDFGNVLGPILAGFIAGFSLSLIYLIFGILCSIGGLIVGRKFREQKPSQERITDG